MQDSRNFVLVSSGRADPICMWLLALYAFYTNPRILTISHHAYNLRGWCEQVLLKANRLETVTRFRNWILGLGKGHVMIRATSTTCKSCLSCPALFGCSPQVSSFVNFLHIGVDKVFLGLICAPKSRFWYKNAIRITDGTSMYSVQAHQERLVLHTGRHVGHPSAIIKHTLMEAVFCTYLVGFLPIKMVLPHHLYYDPFQCALHGLYVFVSAGVLLILQYLFCQYETLCIFMGNPRSWQDKGCVIGKQVVGDKEQKRDGPVGAGASICSSDDKTRNQSSHITVGNGVSMIQIEK